MYLKRIILFIIFSQVNFSSIAQVLDTMINYNFSGEACPINSGKFRIKLFRQRFIMNRIIKREKGFKIRQIKLLPVASAILGHYNIPDDFKYLLISESLLKDLKSSKGAIGYWQIMDKTAIDFGLNIYSNLDERRSFIKSTNMACWYIKFLFNKFHSWTLAAAAYNEGPSRLSRQILNQKCKDYYSLRLSNETGSYLYKILAIKYL